jgi:hypothetical protein
VRGQTAERAGTAPLRNNVSFLREAMAEADWATALRLFEYTVVRIECPRPADLADHPDLPVRLRGAFGESLHKFGDDWLGRPDPFSRLHPFEFLFGEHGHFRPHAPIPKPFQPRARLVGETLIVEIRLVGRAQFYAPQVAKAMAWALCGGIAFWDGTRTRHPILVDSVAEVRRRATPPPVTARGCSLVFRSPLCIRSRRELGLTGSAFINGLLSRAEGLLQWLGLRVAADARRGRRTADDIAVDQSGMRYARWVRHSRRQGNESIPMEGLTGTLRLSGDLGPILPALAICEQFGVGSHASLGLGCFDAAYYPG